MVYSTRRFVLCLTLCHFVPVLFSPFSIAITSLGEERANLCAFRTFVRFVLDWICRFPLPLVVWEELRFVIVPALPGLFSYLFVFICGDCFLVVAHLSLFWCLWKTELRDCDIFWVSSLISCLYTLNVNRFQEVIFYFCPT